MNGEITDCPMVVSVLNVSVLSEYLLTMKGKKEKVFLLSEVFLTRVVFESRFEGIFANFTRKARSLLPQTNIQSINRNL